MSGCNSTICNMPNRYFEQRALSGFSPATYGGIAASQYDTGIKINWTNIFESAITGIMVAIISTYALKAIGENK